MFTKILGLGDMYVVFAMLLSPFLPLKAMLYAAGWLILKGGMFAFGGDIASFIDIGCGLYMVFFAFGLSITFVSIVVALYLSQKFMISWL